MPEITIFAALGWERRALLSALLEVRPDAAPGTWSGHLGDGTTCLVVQTGMGPKRAAAAAARAPRSRLFLGGGCAGGLAPWLQAGDLVVADGVSVLDAEGRGGETLTALGGPVVAAAVRRGVTVHAGRLAASPAVLATRAAKDAAAASGALAVDMESGALAREAAARGIPFVALRVVLDTADETVPTELDVVDGATGELRIGRMLATLAWRPSLWPALGRLARQSRRADASLRALVAALFHDGGLEALVGPAPAHAAVG